MPDCPFRHVIIPRDAIVFNERKETLSIPLKPILILARQLRMIDLLFNHSFIEVIDLLAKLLKMSLLEPILLNGSEDGDEQVLHFQDEYFKFSVKGCLPEILVHIANQMN